MRLFGEMARNSGLNCSALPKIHRAQRVWNARFFAQIEGRASQAANYRWEIEAWFHKTDHFWIFLRTDREAYCALRSQTAATQERNGK